MSQKYFSYSFFLATLLVTGVFVSCNNGAPVEKDIAATPEELDQKITTDLQKLVSYAAEQNGHIGDSVILFNTPVVTKAYAQAQFAGIWSSRQQWKPTADSLLSFIRDAKMYGLFPEDYHYVLLDSITKLFAADSLVKKEKRDAALWTKADIAFTDAFFHIVKDIKLGRLERDSTTLRKDSLITEDEYLQQLNSLKTGKPLSTLVATLEPKHTRYHELKRGIKEFLRNATDKEFTKVPSPKSDPAAFKVALQKRLHERGYIAFDSVAADSVQLADAVKLFQKESGIAVDGKAGEGTVRMLNISDRDKFVRIAISLDRYKLLPEEMPDRYVWVNLPSYYLELQQEDSILLRSRIVCGKAITRTPILTSSISELVTYPQWTIPTSIIVKEILPAVKRNPEYLIKKGYNLIDSKGEVVDPYSVDWSKYSKGIPYRVVQGSGDDNALGILKFNFPNKYAVYLHDTNQRYLFGQPTRSLSHGCVRVQEWEKLTYYIIRYDNKERYIDKTSPTEDSVKTWLVRKEKHHVPVKKRLPLYIRYFTSEGKDGKIAFYDDIYGEDKFLQEKYFAGK